MAARATCAGMFQSTVVKKGPRMGRIRTELAEPARRFIVARRGLQSRLRVRTSEDGVGIGVQCDHTSALRSQQQAKLHSTGVVSG